MGLGCLCLSYFSQLNKLGLVLLLQLSTLACPRRLFEVQALLEFLDVANKLCDRSGAAGGDRFLPWHQQ